MEDRSLGLRLQPDPARWTLGRFLDDVAERHGDRTALVFRDDALSFSELRGRARTLARGLVGAGVVKGARVALLMANRPEWVVAYFAVGLVGGVLVPVNTFATPDERDWILRHSDASLLLVQRRLLRHRFLDDLLAGHPEVLEGAAGRLRCAKLPQLRRVVCFGLAQSDVGVEPWSALERHAEDVPESLVDGLAAEVTPADDALVIYTSGTTDRPKGILHAQRAPVIQSWRFAESMRLTPEDRVLTAQPFFWTAGIAMSLGASLAAGARLHLHESFEPEKALRAVEKHAITTLHAWPHQEKAMAEHADLASRDLGSLRKIEFSSPLAKAAGLEKNEWGTYAAYGLSETFTLASSLPADTPAELRRATSGRPLPGMHLRILEPATGAALRAGEEGEIAVKGATFMRGYHKLEPELYLDVDGYFRTQDGGSLDADGYLHWSGRLSNLIKTGGANVAPAEIESALERYPGLQLAAAVGVPHPTLGEAVVLCVVPSEGAELDADALLAHLREKLAAYKIPRAVLRFAPGDVQYTGNQKVQVGPLREAALRQLADARSEIAGHAYGDELD